MENYCLFLWNWHGLCSSLYAERPMEDSSRKSLQKDSFDGSRKDINAAIDHICEFTGKSCQELILSHLQPIHS